MFYTGVATIGDYIYERKVVDGKEKVIKTLYKPNLFSHTESDSKYKDIYGKNCKKREFDTISDAKRWVEKMKDMELEVLGQEDFKLAYISDKYPDTIQYDRNLIRVANVDIEVTAPEFPDPTAAAYPIDAITHYDSIDDKLYVFDLLDSQFGRVDEWSVDLAGKKESEGGDEIDQDILDRVVYMAFSDEKEMLLQYISFWRENYPAILTGWNVETFDIPYIINRITNLFGADIVKALSPFKRHSTRVINNIYGDKIIHRLSGIAVLDYIDLYKKFSYTNQPTYKLDYIAEYETGKGKLPYDGPLGKLREYNHQRYISYNIIDVWSVQQIDRVRGFVDLAISIAYYAKIGFNDIMSPIKTWDGIIFNSLKESHTVLPENVPGVKQQYPGAFVKDPVIRAYRYVISFDATSLYPSVIRQVNISPETIAGSFVPRPIIEYINKEAPMPSDEYSSAPNGIMYRKDKQGVIPKEITKVFFQRKEWKKRMLTAQRNLETIKNINGYGHETKLRNIDFYSEFTDDITTYLMSLDEPSRNEIKRKCETAISLADTNQLNRKILINSLYGAMGNAYFRFFDIRNASAITTFGQMVIQWSARKINEYMNKLLNTKDVEYVFYIDTDSNYIEVTGVVDKVGIDRFKTQDELIDFLDKFAERKIKPLLTQAFDELKEYMNSYEQQIFMDREAIACPPLNSKGIGGFWKAKKRYALNVYDMENIRYKVPKLKIMGMETQRSDTPKTVRNALKESIRLMLQEGEDALQDYYKQYKESYFDLDCYTVASISSANNIEKYNANGFPGFKCPAHIRGVLAYKRAIDGIQAPDIFEGDKVMVVPLKERNPFNERVIAWPSGNKIPSEIAADVIDSIDYTTLFNKTFEKPLSDMCECAGLSYEKKASLSDMFDF